MRTEMIAMTTRSSIRVKPRSGAGRIVCRPRRRCLHAIDSLIPDVLMGDAFGSQTRSWTPVPAPRAELPALATSRCCVLHIHPFLEDRLAGTLAQLAVDHA